MVSGRRLAGRGGGQIGRSGGQIDRGESSNGAVRGREKSEAEKEVSDRARVLASYRYLNYGRRPPPAYYRRESACDLAALRASSSRRLASSSAPSSSAASTSRAEPPQLPGRAGDYVDDADFGNVLVALAAEPTFTLQDFIGEQYIDGMIELVQQATVGQEEKEAEIRQIAKDQPFVFLDSDED